jgi:putative membrane protein insertion efficiency factor
VNHLARLAGGLAWLADGLIRGWQILVRPLLPSVCRFAPSCSEYAREAIRGHGLIAGAWLSVRRIGRCHPFHPGGYDPPPPAGRAGLEERRT